MGFESLQGYQPQKLDEGFEVIKERNLSCGVEYARIEPYKGQNPELQGTEFYNYCLTVIDHPTLTGRRLWKRFRLDDDDQLKRLANTFFTLGLEFRNREELEKAGEAFVRKTLNVRAWGWTPDGESEARQMHLIKSETNSKQTSAGRPAF